jgi:hypothetical protein
LARAGGDLFELQDLIWPVWVSHSNGAPRISAYLLSKYASLYAISQDAAAPPGASVNRINK